MRLHVLLLCFGMSLLAHHTSAQETNHTSDPIAYVIPLEGTVERALTYVIRRGVTQASRHGASIIIFDIDTYGGRGDAMDDILDILKHVKIPTYSFVNPKAISAGAFIAMGTDHIYMSPGSRIGDAMPIIINSSGGVENLSDKVQEKMISPAAAQMRTTAKSKGHDPDLAEAMVRPENEYKIGDNIICKKGELLTLTDSEASAMVGPEDQQRPLLSEGTVDDLKSLLTKIGKPNHRIVTLTVDPAERFARYIEQFSGLLLMLGLAGIYLEFRTPGFGLPGIAGITLIIIWFWGHNVAGLAGSGEIILLAVGFILLAIEIFVIPGFGFIGLLGMACIISSLVMSMVQHMPGMPIIQVPALQIEHAMLNLAIGIIGSTAIVTLAARYLPFLPLFNRLILTSQVNTEDGYQSSPDSSRLLHSRGIAASSLHPAGIGEFNGRRIDVVTHGNFIEENTPIVVVEAHGNRVVVEASRQ